MPSKNNDKVAEAIVRGGCFANESKKGLPTDNWRCVKDTQGRNALLYIVIFHSESQSGEPKRIPHKPTMVGDLANVHQSQIPSPKFGPFIALAEVSKGLIISVRVWNISTSISTQTDSLRVDELGKPYWQHP
jgi:hypothetical protein